MGQSEGGLECKGVGAWEGHMHYIQHKKQFGAVGSGECPVASIHGCVSRGVSCTNAPRPCPAANCVSGKMLCCPSAHMSLVMRSFEL